MDLLFSRYASPFLFMGEMMKAGRFDEFVIEFLTTIRDETEESTRWEFYLHKVQEGSFAEFVEGIENDKGNQQMTQDDIESTVQESFNILNNFNPVERGEEQNGTL